MPEQVFISGVSRGLGLELARACVTAGAKVYAGARDTAVAPLQALKKEFPALLELLTLDVSNEESVRAGAADMAKAGARLDLCINNAGVNLPSNWAGLEATNYADALKTYDVNALGALRVAQHFLPLLKAPGGLLVNVSSQAGSIAHAGGSNDFSYPMSKAAMNMLTKILHNRIKPHGQRALTLHPGWFKSDMGGKGADLEIAEAARRCLVVIAKAKSEPNGPLYLDMDDKILPW